MKRILETTYVTVFWVLVGGLFVGAYMTRPGLSGNETHKVPTSSLKAIREASVGSSDYFGTWLQPSDAEGDLQPAMAGYELN